MAPALPDDRDHWPRHARQWALVGPPLRPGPGDVAAVAAELAAWQAAHGRPPRVLVLGVTPELVTMAIAAGAAVTAVDRSAAMIGAVLPRPVGAAPPRAIQADWTALPLAPASIDVVIGDGSPSNLRFAGDHRALAAEVARVLAPAGRLVLRLFAASPVAEPLATVAADLAAGRIGSFHALKWRVAMAIQPADRNVAVAAIGAAVEALVPDRAALAARTGWPRPVIDTIDAYRGSALTYAFPTEAEVDAAFAVALRPLRAHRPDYELGDRCPTVTWCRR